MNKLRLTCISIIFYFFACSNDTEPPRVRMYYPPDGDAVWATIYVTATTVDNDSVDRVEFYFADTLAGGVDVVFQDSFYQHIWMTYAGPDSVNVKIYAIAFDISGNSAASDTITVFVDNAGHPPGGN
jgi:hypothetical protein